MKVRGVSQENTEQYLKELMLVTPTAANVLEYAAIVRDRALLARPGYGGGRDIEDGLRGRGRGGQRA